MSVRGWLCLACLAVSAPAAGCGSNPADDGDGGQGAGGGEQPQGGHSASGGGEGGEAGGGGVPWTSGTARYAPVWESRIECTGLVGSRVGDVFVHEGDVFVAGTLNGACEVFEDDTTEDGNQAVIAARLSGDDGTTVWTRVDPVGDALFGFGVAGFGGGGLLFHGGFHEPIQLEGAPELQPLDFADHSPAFTTFMVSLGADGAPIWARALAVEYLGTDFAIESTGTIGAMGGSYAADFGGGPLASSLSRHPIAQLDAEGDEAWSDVVGTDLPSMFFAHEVAIGSDKRTLMTATLQGTMTLGDDALEAEDAISPVIALFDPAGAPLWSFVVAASEDWCELDPVALSDGSFILSGVCGGTLEIGSRVIGTVGSTTGVVFRVTDDGEIAWVVDLPGGGIDEILVAESADGGLVLAGQFHGSVDLGDGEHASAGRMDVYLAGLDADGSTLWSQRIGGEWDDTIEAVVALPNGDLIASTGSSLDPDATGGSAVLHVARLATE